MKNQITAEQIGQALGLTGVSLSITADGIATITANEPITASMRDRVQDWSDRGEVSAALRFRDWLSFKRHAEAKVPNIHIRVSMAALQSPAVLSWILTAAGQGEMHMDHPDTIAGFAALVQAGVITQAERDALFTP